MCWNEQILLKMTHGTQLFHHHVSNQLSCSLHGTRKGNQGRDQRGWSQGASGKSCGGSYPGSSWGSKHRDWGISRHFFPIWIFLYKVVIHIIYSLYSFIVQFGKNRLYDNKAWKYSQSYDFSSGHVWMWELEHKEGWVLKNWCFWTVVLEKTLESPFDSKEIHPVHPKGNQSWIFIGRTDAEAEVPILWPPDVARCWERPWCWEGFKERGKGDNRRWDGWGNTESMGMSFSKLREIVKDREAWWAGVHGVAKSWT